jgi:hypothetical protein
VPSADRRCDRCGGCGRLVLPPVYMRTLSLVRGGWDTAPEVARQDGCAPTAAIDRLEKLRAWGLLRRWRIEPRGYRYAVR